MIHISGFVMLANLFILILLYNLLKKIAAIDCLLLVFILMRYLIAI